MQFTEKTRRRVLATIPRLFDSIRFDPLLQTTNRGKVTPIVGEGGVYDDFDISSEIDDAVAIQGAANVPVCLTMSRVRASGEAPQSECRFPRAFGGGARGRVGWFAGAGECDNFSSAAC